jgi:molybdate transport system substrate-binding protein
LVARGEVPAGIVYNTDVAISDRIRVVAEFPATSHARISYPVALVKGLGTPAAQEFLGFMKSEAALAIFRQHGFTTD